MKETVRESWVSADDWDAVTHASVHTQCGMYESEVGADNERTSLVFSAGRAENIDK